jgi:hypothetical protein
MQPWRWRTTRSRPRPADALQTRSRIGTESSTQNFPRIIECIAMAKTIDEGFEELRFNLEITDLQEKTVSTRQKNVRKALEDDFDILDLR